MNTVLYDSKYGYYSGERTRAIGRQGDFFTSVSVGRAFGFLLAQAIVQSLGGGGGDCSPYVLVEQGAHDGQLADDIVTALLAAGLDKDQIDYRIIEPKASQREQLRQRFAGRLPMVRVVDDIEAARAPRGLFLCNELLDAFPVDCLVFREGEWRERRVGLSSSGDALEWVEQGLPHELRAFCERLGSDFPEGYETEHCPGVDLWMAQVADLFETGEWWMIDYGHREADYYAKHRTRGTLQGYREHRKITDPFDGLGVTDLTAHVNFDQVKRAAEASGLQAFVLTDQHHFLTSVATPWLLSLEGQVPDAETKSLLRQFQTLTHPGMMGSQFKVARARK